MTDVASAQAHESRLAGEVQSLRSEVTLLRDDVALMRSELGALANTGPVEVDADHDARETIRRLWAEGLASGIAGDVDDVVDDILRTIPGPSSPP